MAEVTEKSIIVNGVDKYLVADLKRVYGGVSYQGEEYVFLQFPVVGDTSETTVRTATPPLLCSVMKYSMDRPSITTSL